MYLVLKSFLKNIWKYDLCSSIGQIFNLVNPNNPVFCCISFFQNIQFEILVTYLNVADTVVSWRLTCNET